jgi:quercetin dioxygenase-like cupin family protein
MGAREGTFRRWTVPTGKKPLGDIATDVLFENERVKVWNLNVEPWESSAWHHHRRDYVTVVVEGGGLTVEYEDGTTEAGSSKVGDWRYHGEHRVHRVHNRTAARYKNVLIEIKG